MARRTVAQFEQKINAMLEAERLALADLERAVDRQRMRVEQLEAVAAIAFEDDADDAGAE